MTSPPPSSLGQPGTPAGGQAPVSGAPTPVITPGTPGIFSWSQNDPYAMPASAYGLPGTPGGGTVSWASSQSGGATGLVTAGQSALAACRAATAEIRRERRAIKMAKPIMGIYKNPPMGESGAVYCGRIHYREAFRYEWPEKKNVSSQGYFAIRASHYMARFITSIPNNPEECKNYIIRVDMYDGRWRWTGLGHHWAAETKDGVDVITFYFNHDLQVLQFLLAPPNPLLPIPLFQFPRVWPEFGPSVWCISVLILLNIIRKQGNLWQLPDDPFEITGPSGWLALLFWEEWQVHVKCLPFSFFFDASLWTVLGSRMDTVDSVIADSLDDGQLCITARRYFTDEGETVTGLIDNKIANGALVLEVTDRSGFALPGGTFMSGTAIGGAIRSVLTWGLGFIEDTYNTIADDQSLYPDEYWQHGFLGTFAKAPGICVRDSHYNDLQSVVTHAPATAGSVIVGGDNPTADAIVRLIIESIGNLLGYFLLGGFDSAGTIAADIIMPFLIGTILAWDEWKNIGRTMDMGWIHLWEVYQQGAEASSWSLSALAALRGGFNATKAETSHTMVIGSDTWLIPGLHCQIGDRIMSTSGCLQRTGIDLLYINQIEEMTLTGGSEGQFEFTMKVGQNKAAMTQGERSARLLKKALALVANIGVHLVS